MSGFRYVPGESGWTCVVAPDRLAWLEVGTRDGLVAEIWDALHSGADTQAVLGSLMSNGIAQTPAFAFVVWEGDSIALLARGPIALTVRTSTGIEAIDSSRYSTWAERFIDGVVELGIGAGTWDATSALPIVDGIVVASAVRWEGTDRPAKPRKAAKAAAVEKSLDPVVEVPVEFTPDPEATMVVDDLSEVVAAEPTSAVKAVASISVPPGLIPERDPERDPEPAPEPESADSLLDELFGATVVRTVEDAAVRAPEVVVTPPESDADAGDHDGETIFGDDLAKLRAAAPAADAVPEPAKQAAISHILRSSAGETISLARPVIIGRSPTVTKPIASGEMPDLVAVASSNPDVSRNHVQITVEGGTVVVTDLHSRNGSLYTLPGKTATRLRPGEPTPVIPGTVVDLGGGATYTVDVTE